MVGSLGCKELWEPNWSRQGFFCFCLFIYHCFKGLHLLKSFWTLSFEKKLVHMGFGGVGFRVEGLNSLNPTPCILTGP